MDFIFFSNKKSKWPKMAQTEWVRETAKWRGPKAKGLEKGSDFTRSLETGSFLISGSLSTFWCKITSKKSICARSFSLINP